MDRPLAQSAAQSPEGIARPWESEPNYIQFWHEGLLCALIRNPSLNLCGYVAVPESHPLYKTDYYVSDDIELSDEEVEKIEDPLLKTIYTTGKPLMERAKERHAKDGAIGYHKGDERVNHLQVHGGLTYAADHLPTQSQEEVTGETFDPQWWFGFDTGHFGDFTPRYDDPDSDHNKEMAARYPDWNNTLHRNPDGTLYNTYRDWDYVVREVQSLAKQLADLA